MTLKELKIGQSALIKAVGGTGALRQHFLDMGVIPGAEVTVVKFAPMGDPMELQIHGYELSLRLDEAEKIIIQQNLASNKNNKSKTADILGIGRKTLQRKLSEWGEDEEKSDGDNV